MTDYLDNPFGTAEWCDLHADARRVCGCRHVDTGDGAALLDAVHAFLCRFVAFPSPAAADAVALWAAHAHAVDAFDSTPRLALLSPEPGSGKSRTLEVLELLVPRPLFSMNTSAAALFRQVAGEDGPPTVLIDEADTIFGPRAAKEHEDLRGFVNAGHRRGAMAHRCVVRGKAVEVETFPAYAAVALAGLDDLPDTIMSRSIVVRMRRRAPHEAVEPFRLRLHRGEGETLRDGLAAWTSAVGVRLRETWPQMPAGVEDRNADVWEALVAVADAAGGTWPERARVTAVTHVTDSSGGGESLGVRLLRDLRDAFAGRERVSTDELLAALHDVEESPWGDLRGKPLDARGLAKRLSRYGVKPEQYREGEARVRGYALTDLADVFSRYLPATGVPGVTGGGLTQQAPDGAREQTQALSSPPAASVTTVTTVTECAVCSTPLDRALAAAGIGTHPGCVEEAAS